MTALPPVVLLAHDVHGANDPVGSVVEAGYSTPLPLLLETIEAFRARGYRFVALDEFLGSRDSGGVALLTFDDGYAGVYHRAFPALRRLGVPALCFLVTETLDSTDCFPFWIFTLRDAYPTVAEEDRKCLEEEPVVSGILDRLGASTLQQVLDLPASRLYTTLYPRFSYATLDRMRCAVEELGILGRATLERDAVFEMKASEIFEFGAHSLAHLNLIQVSSDEARRQVTESVRAVADLFGKDPRQVAFAYPHGAVSPAARRAVEQEAKAGFIVRERPVHRLDRLALVPRLTIDETVLQRASRPPRLASVLEQGWRVRMAPLLERARLVKNRLRGSGDRGVDRS